LAGRREGDIVLNPAVDLPHACACNYLADNFLESPADSILFLDDDMVFDYDAVNQIRDAGHDFDILSGLAISRRGNHKPVVLATERENGHPKPILDLKGIVECGYVGLAFTLVRRWVLERIRKETNAPIFNFPVTVGEDGAFCDAARSIGARIGVNTDINIGHRITFTGRWDRAAKTPVWESCSFGLNTTGQ